MEPIMISVARDFSKYPAGRFLTDGPASGERFRRQILLPALSKGTRVIIDLDGTLGYGSSFLEEAFGGLVRSGPFPAEEISKRLDFVSGDPTLVSEIWDYVSKARRMP